MILHYTVFAVGIAANIGIPTAVYWWLLNRRERAGE